MGQEASLRLELFVADVAKAVAFYRDVLGFEVLSGWGEYVPVRLGSVTLGLGPIDGLSAEHYFRPEIERQRRGLGAEIVIEVPDVLALHERVAASGYPISTELKDRPWGLTDFRLSDPDGYFLRISSQR